jgi:hemerythrin
MASLRRSLRGRWTGKGICLQSTVGVLVRLPAGKKLKESSGSVDRRSVKPADTNWMNVGGGGAVLVSAALHTEDVAVQHRRLDQLLDEIIEIRKGQPEARLICKAVYRLLDYMKLHFADEEQFMLSIDYTRECFEAHVATHEAFLVELREWYDRVFAGDLDGCEMEIARISNWLDQHRQQHDQVYLDWAADRDL